MSAGRRVVVIDDDELSLGGAVRALSGAEDVTVEGMTPDAALSRSSWAGVDVAVVDATDRRRHDDHFVGVAVVEAIRSQRTPAETTVVVVTAYSWLDALRVRVREAGADLFFDRMDVQTRDELLAVVRDPSRFRSNRVPGPDDPEQTFRLGVVRATRVNEGLKAAEELGWDERALTRRGRRSRSEDAGKRRFASRSRLAARNRDGTEPDRNQEVPSWPQIASFVDWARRVPESMRNRPGAG